MLSLAPPVRSSMTELNDGAQAIQGQGTGPEELKAKMLVTNSGDVKL